MSESGLSTAVNQHYLNKVMDLTDAMEVHANEDIFDARGNKLLAKGARVSRGLQERLIVHKLRKPLESSIVVEGGVCAASLVASAARILEESRPVAAIVGAGTATGSATLALFGQLKLGGAMSMMLTIADREGPRALDHAVTVALLAIAFARKAGLPELDQRIAGMAGLLHDIGELYVDPSFLRRSTRLLPHEWSHIVIHPHTGQMLVSELEAFPPAVARAVAEHHERYDGSGYPRRLSGNAISVPGQILAIAEMIAGVLGKSRPMERAALALKIVPGEHAKPLLAAISGLLRDENQAAAASEDMSYPGAEQIGHLIARIASALGMARQTLADQRPKSAKCKDILAIACDRIQTVQRAVISTGLDAFADQEAAVEEDDDLRFEQQVATREIQWRLRDIARDLALQNTDPNERLLFVPLINMLDDDFSQVDLPAK